MKFLRKFQNTTERDAAFAQVDYNILSYIRNLGVKVKSDGVDPALATPFYVENPFDIDVTLTTKVHGHLLEH